MRRGGVGDVTGSLRKARNRNTIRYARSKTVGRTECIESAQAVEARISKILVKAFLVEACTVIEAGVIFEPVHMSHVSSKCDKRDIQIAAQQALQNADLGDALVVSVEP